jgi:hypothetical protein
MKTLVFRSLMHGGIFVCSIFVALIVGEGLLRVFDVSYPVFDDFDETRGVRLRPGKEGWYRAEGEAYLRVNSLGYRDREHDRSKPSNMVRIAVLGDSFVEARQVALEDTFWYRLGGELQECNVFRGKQIEMLSFGIGGYNTSQEYLTLQTDVLTFSPDIVLLAMFPNNDIEGNSRELQEDAAWRIPAPTHSLIDGELVLDASSSRSVWRKLLYDMVHRFRVVEMLNEARRTIRAQQWQRANAEQIEPGLSSYVYRQPESREWRQAWLVTEALLAEMNELVHTNGGRFIVTTIPSALEVDPVPLRRKEIESRMGVDDLLYPDQRIAAAGASAGFAVYPLTRELQEIAERQRIYMHGFKNTRLGFGHLNEQGHRQVAGLLATDLCNATDLGIDERRVASPAER